MSTMCATNWNPLDQKQWEDWIYLPEPICDCVAALGEKVWPFEEFSIGVARRLGPVTSLDSDLKRLGRDFKLIPGNFISFLTQRIPWLSSEFANSWKMTYVKEERFRPGPMADDY